MSGHKEGTGGGTDDNEEQDEEYTADVGPLAGSETGDAKTAQRDQSQNVKLSWQILVALRAVICNPIRWFSQNSIAISTIFTALFTGLLVLTSWKMWERTGDTLDQMKMDSEVAFRAYPYVQDPQIFFEVGKSPKLIFWLGNSGQSPVRDIVIKARVYYGVSPDQCSLVGDFDERTLAFDVPGGGNISEMTQLILSNNPVRADFAEILDSPPVYWSRSTIKVVGVIEYRTIFTPDNEPRERTPILFFAEPTSSEAIGHQSSLMLSRDSRRHAHDTTNNGQSSECSN